MEIARFCDNVYIFLDSSSDLGKRLKSLTEKVILRLPQEEQFNIKGQIGFHTRESALYYWQQMGSERIFRGNTPDLTQLNRDGNCTYLIGESVESSRYFITIIVDRLDAHSDSYIMGLIAHELSEMSYTYRLCQKELPSLRNMELKARELRIAEISKQNAPVGSRENEVHEDNVNQEANRLGFSQEIKALGADD